MFFNMESIDHAIQGHFGFKLIDFRKFELVRAITRQELQLQSRCLHNMFIYGPFRTPLKILSIDFDHQGH